MRAFGYCVLFFLTSVRGSLLYVKQKLTQLYIVCQLSFKQAYPAFITILNDFVLYASGNTLQGFVLRHQG